MYQKKKKIKFRYANYMLKTKKHISNRQTTTNKYENCIHLLFILLLVFTNQCSHDS